MRKPPAMLTSQALQPAAASASTAASGDSCVGSPDGPNASVPTAAVSQLDPSDTLPTLLGMSSEKPSRIDLLELDIALRLADLWREAAGINEWTLDVVAAFMRAAYGKGYCDALTEESPGSLCAEHGYEVPRRRPVPQVDPA